MTRALDGIKVVNISQVATVPLAARHLADFGAEVIHVEHQQRGDSWRGYQAGQGGTGGVPSAINYNWETFNRNKKSLAIDLSQPRINIQVIGKGGCFRNQPAIVETGEVRS